MRAPRLVVVTALLAIAAVPSLAVDATKRAIHASEKASEAVMQCWTYKQAHVLEAVDRAARWASSTSRPSRPQKVRPGSEEKMVPA